jgi:hypothetical protein
MTSIRLRGWLALSALLLLAPLGCGGGLGDFIDEDGLPNSDADDGRLPLGTCQSESVPPLRIFKSGPEAYAGYDGQSRCDPHAKPGVVAFSKLVLDTYPCTRSGGIVRACSVGDQSEHKEGRAWDWMVSYPSEAASSLIRWLLADRDGHRDAMARRLGIMYMIWNRRIWKAYEASQGWQPYDGSNPHTDHIHFSFSWAGARKQTSFWDGEPNHEPAGWLQTARCDEGITGWAQDPNQPVHAVHVELHIADKVISTTADVERPDLCDKLGSCHHGFRVPVPPAFKDGQLHHARAFAVDLDTHQTKELNGGPRDFTCP